MMFRAGVWFANNQNETYLQSWIDPGLEINYNTTAKPQSPVNVFVSDFSFFAGAAVVQLFSITITLFTFYGWWRLGRDVTLSPVETAKASVSSFTEQPAELTSAHRPSALHCSATSDQYTTWRR